VSAAFALLLRGKCWLVGAGLGVVVGVGVGVAMGVGVGDEGWWVDEWEVRGGWVVGRVFYGSVGTCECGLMYT